MHCRSANGANIPNPWHLNRKSSSLKRWGRGILGRFTWPGYGNEVYWFSVNRTLGLSL
jgi:hypothetical protein